MSQFKAEGLDTGENPWKKKKNYHTAQMDKDEHGKAYITDRYLKELCEENGQYTTPALNDALYLHYKGFRRIEGLDSYKNIKALWLECNGIAKIEGLENLTKLRMVYLQQNVL